MIKEPYSYNDIGDIVLLNFCKARKKQDELMIRIIIADDHETIRSALSKFINNQLGMIVVGEAKNGAEAIDLIDENRPDILILDIEMPVMDGVAVAQKLKGQNGVPRIIIVSNHSDRYYVEGLMDLGVCGYVIKDDAMTHLPAAIRQVQNGRERWLSPSIQQYAL